MSALVAVCGSRSLPASWAGRVAALVRSVVASGLGVAVSCCPSGAPAFARAACAALGVSPSVWSVASVGFRGRGAFAARAAALVRAVAASGPGAALVVFVSGPCPAGVVPARSWRSGSRPSGSWSECALAAGLGLPVFVVWAGPGAPALPSWPAGSWVPSSAWGLPAWSWSPAAVQPSLF